jgi:hypothetical protein
MLDALHHLQVLNILLDRLLEADERALGRTLLKSLLLSLRSSGTFLSGRALRMAARTEFQLYGSAKAKTRSFLMSASIRAAICRRAVSWTLTNHSVQVSQRDVVYGKRRGVRGGICSS